MSDTPLSVALGFAIGLDLTREELRTELQGAIPAIADLERQLATMTVELAQYKASSPLCEEHKPTGGARGSCLVCACIKLSAAIDRIDYACDEPNEMEVSGYTVHCNEDVVVENVQKLKAERDAAIKPWCPERESNPHALSSEGF